VSVEYYFLISSLPRLALGEAPPWTSADLLDSLAYHLPASDVDRIRALDATPPVEPFCPAARRWNEIEIFLRNYVVRNRRDTDRRRAEEWTREAPDVFPGLEPQIDEALNAPNPLEREQTLDRIRWQALEEARFARPFAVDAVAVYRLRLILVEKWAGVDAEAGLRRVRALADELRPHAQLQEAGLA
jgi:hypothetical protein